MRRNDFPCTASAPYAVQGLGFGKGLPGFVKGFQFFGCGGLPGCDLG